MLTAPLPSSALQSDRDDPDDPDYRLGHKRRQQARRQDRKREAVKGLLERLHFDELPLASILTISNDIDNTNANANSTSAIEEENNEKKKSTQLSDLYQPICRLDDDVTNEFWSKVPAICNPNKAVMEEKISDERDLMRERYRSDKYRRKLKKQMERGDINQTQVDDLWEKHGKRTTNTNANNIDTEDTDETNNNSQAKQQTMATTTTAAAIPTNSSCNNEAVSLLSNDRGQRKAWQVENFVSLLRERLSSSSNYNSRIGNSNNSSNSSNEEFALTVVDFGCGSGNLCLALASYFSQVRFVLVDKKSYSLKLAERRARDAGLKNVQIMEYEFSPSNLKDFCIPSMSRLSTMMPLSPSSSSTTPELSNIVCMPVTQNTDETSTTTTVQQQQSSSSSTDFDIAIGLHCCGSFTDMVMMIARFRGADCIVCPCCNGAMTSETTCGYEYPRSSYVRKLINQDEYLSLLSRAADDLGSYEAKCFIEYDRALWANENGYNVKLLKLSPEESTPKHHVLYLTKQIQKGEEHED
jgi:2-polyprenyl-3-methyl-5-hydroxy-6-metoxy-1,4-benzoquinol methylase